MKSKRLYKRAVESTTVKGRRSLENLKRVCDFLESRGIGLSIAMVGRELKRQGIGPGEQAIRNNRTLAEYVGSRAEEQIFPEREFAGEGELVELLKYFQRENKVLRGIIKSRLISYKKSGE